MALCARVMLEEKGGEHVAIARTERGGLDPHGTNYTQNLAKDQQLKHTVQFIFMKITRSCLKRC